MRHAFILQMVLIISTLNLMGLSSPIAKSEKNLLVFSSREGTGFYYPTAGSIANAVNQNRNEHGFRITVQSRRSSNFILNGILSGEIYFGEVLQSRVYQAYKGLANWKGRPQADLCSIFNTHPNYIVLIVSVESGIRTMRDLKDKRVGVGSPGSDLYYCAIDILAAVGLNYRSDISVTDERLEALPDLLQEGDIDAFFYPVATPSRAIMDLMSGSKKVLAVSIAAPGIDALVAANPFYEKVMLRSTRYPGLEQMVGIEAVGVKMSLITSCEMPDKAVYAIAKETFNKHGQFGKEHPRESLTTKKAMIENLPASVHPGAMQYYKESAMDALLRP